jgi:hypothetical protein
LHTFNKKVASGSRRGARRDASPRPSVLITRKKYKSKNGVKVKKTKYRIKSRDPAVQRDVRPASGGASPRSRITKNIDTKHFYSTQWFEDGFFGAIYHDARQTRSYPWKLYIQRLGSVELIAQGGASSLRESKESAKQAYYDIMGRA